MILLLMAMLAPFAGCGGDGNNGSHVVPTATSTPIPSPTPAAGAGLISQIADATIDDAGEVTVTFTVTDENGIPLSATLASAESPQQARVRFTLAHLEEYAGGGQLGNTFLRYVNEIDEQRPAFDSNGTLEPIDPDTGTYRYRFAVRLDMVDPALTYSVGAQVDRTFDDQQLSANPVFDFVPDGGTPQVREDTTTAQCNACHAPLIAHGNRREVRLCTLCHTEAAIDEKGVSIDFRNMIHKIHAGKQLPSVVDGPPGSFYGIFSARNDEEVVFAEKLDDGSITGVGFPRVLEECSVCHSDGPTAEFYRTKASAPACATCHDDVNPSLETTAAGPPGTKHPPGPYADGQCSACHLATQNKEFDITVPGAHVVPERSTQLHGLNVTITDVANHAAGEMPEISFVITDDAGMPLHDLSGLSSLTFTYAGPTTDYTRVLSAAALGSSPAGTLVGPDAAGGFQFTPDTPIPADAMGSWSLGAEARRTVQLTSTISATEAAPNPVGTFSVDDSPLQARRTVVANDTCGGCHGEFSKDFSIHGGSRNNVAYCVFCHNPTQSDADRRNRDPAAVAAGEATSTIDFKVLIHKIHRGQALEQQPYLVYGFGSAPLGYSIHDFGDVRFPGDLRICGACHVDDSNLIPPYPDRALPTDRTRLDPETGDEIPDVPPQVAPITSVCTSCHDSDEAAAHAATNTAVDGTEACSVCHEEGRSFAVSELHAGRN